MIEKQKKLRKMEFVFTDDKVNPVCHFEYDVVISEDGKEVVRSKLRENFDSDEARVQLAKAQRYIHPVGP